VSCTLLWIFASDSSNDPRTAHWPIARYYDPEKLQSQQVQWSRIRESKSLLRQLFLHSSYHHARTQHISRITTLRSQTSQPRHHDTPIQKIALSVRTVAKKGVLPRLERGASRKLCSGLHPKRAELMLGTRTSRCS
jgi:hypothetical protein